MRRARGSSSLRSDLRRRHCSVRFMNYIESLANEIREHVSPELDDRTRRGARVHRPDASTTSSIEARAGGENRGSVVVSEASISPSRTSHSPPARGESAARANGFSASTWSRSTTGLASSSCTTGAFRVQGRTSTTSRSRGTASTPSTPSDMRGRFNGSTRHFYRKEYGPSFVSAIEQFLDLGA